MFQRQTDTLFQRHVSTLSQHYTVTLFQRHFSKLSQCHTAILFQRHISTLPQRQTATLFFIFLIKNILLNHLSSLSFLLGHPTCEHTNNVTFLFDYKYQGADGIRTALYIFRFIKSRSPYRFGHGGICQYCVKNINRVHNYVSHSVTDYATVQPPPSEY